MSSTKLRAVLVYAGCAAVVAVLVARAVGAGVGGGATQAFVWPQLGIAAVAFLAFFSYAVRVKRSPAAIVAEMRARADDAQLSDAHDDVPAGQ